MAKRKIAYWVIPPEQDAEFVACMEDVLETYAAAYDPTHPVLCMDEQPVQWRKETRVLIAATAQHGTRVDYAYERHGTASIFMCAEPLSGFRHATARTQRTKADWAIEVAQILDTRYADSAYVTLVCDNLNTHTKGAFYTAFPPELARAYIHLVSCLGLGMDGTPWGTGPRSAAGGHCTHGIVAELWHFDHVLLQWLCFPRCAPMERWSD